MAYTGNTPITQSFAAGTDIFVVGATAQTVFTLTRIVGGINDIQVAFNTNLYQPSSANYTVLGNTLTLTSGVSGGTLFVRYLSTTTFSLLVGAASVTNNSLVANFLLPIGQGGTGATTQQAALNALSGSLGGTSGRYLRSDGTNVSLSTIQAADVPILNQNTTGTASNVTGVVGVVNGGTGLSLAPTSGQLLIGNGTGYTQATLTAGTGVSVTNGAGSISIANTGVTQILAGSGINVSGATGAVTVSASGGGGLGGMQVFTASGTFTVPAGKTVVKVTLCGGGGAGGAGGSGGTTSFGSFISATGGASGNSGGGGGTGSGGARNITGGAGTTNRVIPGDPCQTIYASGGGVGGYPGNPPFGTNQSPNNAIPTIGIFGGTGGVGGVASGFGNGGSALDASNSVRSGGAGGYAQGVVTGLTPGNTVTVTIGAGGSTSNIGFAGSGGICIVEW